jgi:pentose-5-phosphate-3-epimerase
LNIILGTDGGIHLANAQSLIAAGADDLIIGTAWIQSEEMAEFVCSIKKNY